MKKVAFVSEMALLEPNLSIVKRLNTTYDGSSSNLVVNSLSLYFQ